MPRPVKRALWPLAVPAPSRSRSARAARAATAAGRRRTADDGAGGKQRRHADAPHQSRTSRASTRGSPTPASTSTCWRRPCARSTRYAPDDPSELVPDLAAGRAADLSRRQDAHGENPQRREIRPAGQPRGDGAETSSTRSSAASTRTSPTRTRAPTTATSSAPTERAAARSPASRRPTTTRSSSGSRARPPRCSRSRPCCRCRRRCRPSTRSRSTRRRRRDYANHLVSSGPYMIAGRQRRQGARRRATCPAAASSSCATPTGRAATDHRPAYLDEIDFEIGGSPTVSGRQVLAGRGLVLGDPPTPALVKTAYQQARDQIFFSPGAGTRYAALNTAIPPFDDANVRKAVAAALDREQMRRVRGGEVVGDVASHFLYPGVRRLRGGRRAAGHRRRLPRPPGGRHGARGKIHGAAGYPERQIHRRRDDPGRRPRRRARQQRRADRRPGAAGPRLQRRTSSSSTPRVMYGRFCARAESEECTSARTSAGSATSPIRRRCSTPPSTAPASSPRTTRTGRSSNDPKINAAMARARAGRRRAGAARGVGGDRPHGHRDRRRDPVAVGQTAERLRRPTCAACPSCGTRATATSRTPR